MVAWVAIYVARQKTPFMSTTSCEMSNGARKSGASTDGVASKVAKTVHAREANTPETDEIR